MHAPLLPPSPLSPSSSSPTSTASYDKKTTFLDFSLLALALLTMFCTIANLEDVKYTSDDPPTTILCWDNWEVLLLWISNILQIILLFLLYRHKALNTVDIVESRSPTSNRIRLLTEILICCLSPTTPTINPPSSPTTFSPHSLLSLACSIRLYHLGRVLRDRCPLYSARVTIRALCHQGCVTPPRWVGRTNSAANKKASGGGRTGEELTTGEEHAAQNTLLKTRC